MRKILCLLVLVCGCDSTGYQIAVHNQGAGRVTVFVTVFVQRDYYVYVDTDRRTDSFDLLPGDLWVREIGASEAGVMIVRASDGALLFDDFYDGWDFKDEHGKIEISVFP